MARVSLARRGGVGPPGAPIVPPAAAPLGAPYRWWRHTLAGRRLVEGEGRVGKGGTAGDYESV